MRRAVRSPSPKHPSLRAKALGAIRLAAHEGSWRRLQAVVGRDGEPWNGLVPAKDVWHWALRGVRDTAAVLARLPPIDTVFTAAERAEHVVDQSERGHAKILRWLARQPGMGDAFRLDGPTARDAINKAFGARRDATVLAWLDLGALDALSKTEGDRARLLCAAARFGLPDTLHRLLHVERVPPWIN